MMSIFIILALLFYYQLSGGRFDTYDILSGSGNTLAALDLQSNSFFDTPTLILRKKLIRDIARTIRIRICVRYITLAHLVRPLYSCR